MKGSELSIRISDKSTCNTRRSSKFLGFLRGVVNFSVLLEHVTVSLSQEHTKPQVPITSYNLLLPVTDVMPKVKT